MKARIAWFAAFIAFAIVFTPAVMSARHISRTYSNNSHHNVQERSSKDAENKLKDDTHFYWRRVPLTERKGAETLQIAGSSLPDCSHACGSCSPCRLVMVSFVCATLEEAETCPMAYKCMCKNKSYPVP